MNHNHLRSLVLDCQQVSDCNRDRRTALYVDLEKTAANLRVGSCDLSTGPGAERAEAAVLVQDDRATVGRLHGGSQLFVGPDLQESAFVTRE